MSDHLPICVSLWIGERLSPIERACLRSMLAMGHQVELYCYEPLRDVPSGVRLVDAATILPADAIIRHRSGSVALFSDRFRFELQRRGKGLWVDLDVYMLTPVAFSNGQALFGWQDRATLGAGVLYLPADSPVIARVLDLFEHPYVPDWLRLSDRIQAYWRSRRAGTIELADLPWGVAGPLALTGLARRFGLLDHAAPRDVFYPYHWDDAGWIFDPSQSLDRHVTPRTRTLHLYNHMIAARKFEPAAAGSFMDRLQQEGA